MAGIRTTPVAVGTSPYNWNSKYVYQCTWYVYGRCGEKGLPYPCWFSGCGSDGYGAYTDAKQWLDCFRSPWIPIYVSENPDYVPVENDVVVFDGTLGHVAFIEKVFDDTALLSQYKNGDINSFSNYNWKIGTSYTGKLLGYLHCPKETINPVDRNKNVDQIKTTDDQLRIRTKPNLTGEIVGHVQLGYYNVLSQKEALIEDKAQVDGLTCWYEISKNRWCANITTEYLPTQSSDIMRQIKEYFDLINNEIAEKTEENKKLKEGISQIVDIGSKLL